MKKIWKIRKDKEGVSPVIATILMVAITVVLAAVLYVMVMGFGPGPDWNLGITFDQEDRTGSTISLSVVTAPDTAFVEGTSTTITHDGVPSPVNNVTLYGLTGVPVAWNSGDDWTYADGYDADSLKFREGMTVLITADSIENEDIIKLSSEEAYYRVSKFTVR